MTLEWITDVLQIIFADIILSGDNARVIGRAAAGLAPQFRRRAIMIGMAMAAIMRILFAVIASYLIAIKGILLIGGALLAWVCWRFYKDLLQFNNEGGDESPGEEEAPKKFGAALVTIMLADVSMSLDNVVAVAAIARDDTQLLIFGLALAILIMALFASVIMKVMLKYKWLSWAGLVFLVYLTAMMLFDGARDLGLIAM